ncbi:D-alanyl-D-alanine carboxypeptidase family protein [Candidatus Electrothrix sp.]|uniref:D-alanyl-D-alanine carboxypeptidase family protein n=1 Tax=Candidatus Electrothrix sp. TaxID=2170559 RepID=UPI004055F726
MHRYSFLLITLLAPCVITLSTGHPQAEATVPVLDNTAKKAPHAKTLPALSPSAKITSTPTAKKSGPIILGEKGNISSVKKCVAKVSYTASTQRTKKKKKTRLPAIHRHITSRSAIILDAETGKAIFAKAPDNPRQPASTIKVLTGMIAMKRLKKDEKVEVSRYAEKMPRSKVYLSTQKKYTANDLINAVLLASANDASVALAEKIAGTEDDFAKLMTLHARLWGAKSTVCRTASGLTARGQQSTARDLAQIFRHAMQDKDFANRMKLTKIKTSYGKLLRNHNRALWQVEGALAGKTGYTNKARQTYVGQFKRGEDTIVVSIMGSETMWTDIKRLVEYGFKKKEQIRLAQLTKNEKES